MAVTQGLGDGFALYNGAKLPNIESVWTEELKETYPYAVIGRHKNSVIFVAKSTPFTAYDSGSVPGNIVPTLSIPVQYLCEDGVWVTTGGAIGQTIEFVWTNTDLYAYEDATLLVHAATSPLPLDGMQVIEWDGDVTGLLNAGNYYLISEYADASSAIAALKTDKDLQIGQNLQKTDNRWTVDEVSEEGASSIDYVLADSRYGIGFYKDGTVYTTLLAYTPAAEPEQPTWTFNLQDFLSGMASAAASRGVMPRRTPIAYMYNGVQLPGLPEWDKEKYPYAYIGTFELMSGSTTLYYASLYVSKYPFYVTSEGKTVADSYEGLLAANIRRNNVSGEWERWELKDKEWDSDDSGHPAVWANYDILNADGTTYLEASDPVPVYE